MKSATELDAPILGLNKNFSDQIQESLVYLLKFHNIILFFYQKEDITLRFTLSGSSDITQISNIKRESTLMVLPDFGPPPRNYHVISKQFTPLFLTFSYNKHKIGHLCMYYVGT